MEHEEEMKPEEGARDARAREEHRLPLWAAQGLRVRAGGAMKTKLPFWYCDACGAQNHELDGDCQWCDEHECYITGEDWERAGRPDDASTLPCSRCGQRVGQS